MSPIGGASPQPLHKQLEQTWQAFTKMPATLMMIVYHEHPTAFRPEFGAWLGDNLHVFRRFEIEANKLWDRGRRHYSARTIIEVLRHESALSDTGAEYKLNDHNTPDMARLYVLAYPEREGFFATRIPKGSERGQ